MPEHKKTELRIQVVDDEIIVTRPGSFYSVTYYKPERSAQLLAKRMPDRDDLRIAMKLSGHENRTLALTESTYMEKARNIDILKGGFNAPSDGPLSL